MSTSTSTSSMASISSLGGSSLSETEIQTSVLLSHPQSSSIPSAVQAVLGDPVPQASGVKVEIDPCRFSLLFRATTGAQRSVNLNEEIANEAARIFNDTKKLIVKRYQLESDDIQINYTTQTAIYKDSKGNEQTVDLLEGGQQDQYSVQIQQKMQKFMDVIKEHRPHGGGELPEYEKMTLGPVSGKSFFSKPLNGLSRSLEQFAKKDLEKLMKMHLSEANEDGEISDKYLNNIQQRMVAMAVVDLYKKDFVKTLKEKIEELKVYLKEPESKHENVPEDSRNDLKILEEMFSAFSQLHNQALYAFFALIPNEENQENADKIEGNLRTYLLRDQKIDRTWWGLKEKEGGLEESDHSFIQGVGALQTGLSKKRVDFLNYLERKKIDPNYGVGGEYLLISYQAYKAVFGNSLVENDVEDFIQGIKNPDLKNGLKGKIEEICAKGLELNDLINKESIENITPARLIERNTGIIQRFLNS